MKTEARAATAVVLVVLIGVGLLLGGCGSKKSHQKLQACSQACSDRFDAGKLDAMGLSDCFLKCSRKYDPYWQEK